MAHAAERPTGWGDPPVARPGIEQSRHAAGRIKRIVVRTPLIRFEPVAGASQEAVDIWLKPEVLQPTGSFKVRGVYNWAVSLEPRQRLPGFSTFSAGNTALALAHAAGRFGVSCRSLLPEYAPASKVEALRARGVDTVLVPAERMWEWLFAARWREEPQAFLHPWTEPLMVAGHGTIGLELIEDLPDVDTVFVPVGGGALAAGIGSVLKALRPEARVVGVQSEGYPALAESLAAGRPVWVEPRPTVCDGVAVPFVTDGMFPLLRSVVDEVVLVSDDEVREAIRLLAANVKLVAEGAGAMSLAAAIREPASRRGRTACLVTGGSIGPDRVAALLAAGPAA